MGCRGCGKQVETRLSCVFCDKKRKRIADLEHQLAEQGER